MSNSSLVNYTKLSPNNSGRRTHAIDRITPHCVVGQCSVETLGNIFASSSRQASCNYGIGADGRVLLCVDEGNRSWCSSSNANDQRSVTIECASDTKAPYAFNGTVYAKLIDLCTDICKRNGKTKLIWFGDKTKTLTYSPKPNEMVLTVHRWFANKACPGDWLMARMGDLASTVTSRLGGSASVQPVAPSSGSAPVTSTGYIYEVTVPDLRIRKTPGGALTGHYTGKGKFTIVTESNGWGKLKSGAGWISLDPRYGHKVSSGSAPQASSGEFRWTVTISDLRIRKTPGGALTGHYTGKGTFTITEQQNGWGRLKSGAGWISLDTRYGHRA